MSARTVPVIARNISVQQVTRADAKAPSHTLREAETFSTGFRVGHNPPTTGGQAVETSLPPVIGVDLLRVSRQLESIARRQEPRIAFRSRGTIVLVNLIDIVAVKAEGNYVSLQHRPHRYLVHESLSSMADKLKPYGFIRIHRSVVVNIMAVEAIQPLVTGEYRLHVVGGREYLVTRTYKHNLKNLAQLWVGTERLCGQ